MDKEEELVERIRKLTERCERLEGTIRGLRADLKESQDHAENTSETLDRLKRRLQAIGTIEPGGEG